MQALEEVNKAIHPKGNKPITFNLTEAINLRLKHNLSYQQLADYYGEKKSTIHKRLRKFASILDKPEALDTFQDIRKDILSAAEIKLLEKIVDDKAIKEASLNNAAYAYNTVFQANRLERGQATQITDNLDSVNQLRQLLDKISKRKEELQTVEVECKDVTSE